MAHSLKIYVTGDNCSIKHDFLAHFGQSLVIELDGKKVLFDTGEFSYALNNNLKQFGMDYADLDSIVVSHAHFDHVVGLTEIVKLLDSQKIYIPEQLFQDWLVDKQLQRYNLKLDLAEYTNYQHKVMVSEAMQLMPDFYLSGPLASDKLPEQSIYIDLHEKGLVVIVGCSHPGIEAIISKGQELTGNQKIFALMGGLHFMDDDETKLSQHMDYLSKVNPQYMIPMHCTGQKAMSKMYEIFGKDRVVLSQVGSIGAGNVIQLAPEVQLDFERRY